MCDFLHATRPFRLALVLGAVLWGHPAGTVAQAAPSSSSARGEVVVYYSVRAGSPRPVVARIQDLEAMTIDGEGISLATGPLELRSAAGPGADLELLRASLPAGVYRSLRLTLARAARPDGEAPVVQEVRLPFRIKPQAATTLFLSWTPDAAQGNSGLSLSGRAEQVELRSLLLFVSNQKSDDLSVIQRHRDQVVGVVKVGREPMGVDADPAGRKVYVANAGSDSVSVIDTSTRQVLDQVHLDFGARPVDVAISRSGRRLYVVAAEAATLLVFDTSSLQELNEVEVGLRPTRVVLSPDDRTVYVSNQLSNSVSILDARTLRTEATVPVESRPSDMAVDARQNRVYVGHLAADGVVILGANRTLERTLHFGAAIGALTLDDEGQRLYLSAPTMDRLLIGQARSESVTGFVPLPGPGRLALDPDGKKIYVLDPEGNRVQIVNRLLARKEGTIPTGSHPYDLVLLP
ncbi:MAG: YncE family protein [Acidobacteriota bacterium]